MATPPEYAPSRATPAWRQKLAAFWRWWTHELAQLLPERFAALRGARRAPQLAVEGDAMALIEPRLPEGAESRVEAGLDAQRRRAAVRSLLERAGESRARARLVLDRGEALVRRVTMPAATEENLAQVLAFEMDRVTPFRADDVYFDHRVVGRDPAAGTITVLIAVARRDLIDARLEALRSLGLSIQGVAVREDAAHAGAPLDLLPSEQRGERETPRERLAKRALAGVVAALLVAVLFLPAWRKRETIKELHPVLAKATAEAQATDQIARDLERQVADYNFLLAKKHATPPALAYIEDISRLLPDNTWVQQLDLKQAGKTRELQITGETASSSKLIEILEQSKMLHNATPRGTVTRGSQPGTERFMIAAETRGRTAPEAQPLGDGATPPPAPAAAAPQAPSAQPAVPPPPAAKVEPVPPKAPAEAKAPAKPAPGK